MHLHHHEMGLILVILYTIGISAESMSGAISAGRKDMDVFGVVTVAVVTALGGGSIRDMLLGYYPLTWVGYPRYIIITIICALIAILVSKLIMRLKKLFLVLDAIGLVTFSYLGSTLGYQASNSIIIAMIMAAVTGVSGGMMRDILCNNIPLVFKSELYASVALLVGLAQGMAQMFNYDNYISAILIFVVGFTFRMLAIFKKLYLPNIYYKD